MVPSTNARRRRRAVAVTLVAASFVATSVYWLATAGSTDTTINPAPGLGAEGNVADISNMSATVTRMNGGAQKETGKTIGKAVIAKDFTDRVRIGIAWTNPLDADKVLNNPNAQLQIGLYYPTSTTTAGCSDADAVKVTDGATSFCTLLDSSAGGSSTVSGGQLFLAQQILSGYLQPSVHGSGSLPACAADTGSPTMWCQPSGGYAGASQRLMYIVTSITVPGGVPKGQQSQVGSLQFFMRARRVG
jgi:hypothetical protein